MTVPRLSNTQAGIFSSGSLFLFVQRLFPHRKPDNNPAAVKRHGSHPFRQVHDKSRWQDCRSQRVRSKNSADNGIHRRFGSYGKQQFFSWLAFVGSFQVQYFHTKRRMSPRTNPMANNILHKVSPVLGFFIRKMIVVSESRETGIPISAPPIANAYIGATIGRRIKNWKAKPIYFFLFPYFFYPACPVIVATADYLRFP